ncbi:DUF1318 domain-containing protein [Leptospira sp. 96542]|nr:DUF1318 domain-containing protein [Leptospira sp. 96542]
MNKLSIVLVLPLLLQCKSIFNFSLPPITITNAQTAAEKQMVGEDRELEKDGWLISSIQSSSNGLSNKEKSADDDIDPDIKIYRLRINYLSNEAKRYKMAGIIGEGIGGVLKWNPIAKNLPTYTPYEIPAKRKRVDDVISYINTSRLGIIEKEIQIEKKKGKKEDELLKLKQSLLDENYKSASVGEYYESNPGRWEKL